MTPPRLAIAADSVFDGRTVQRDRAVLIEGERIGAVVPRSEVPENVSLHQLPAGVWLAPGFIDVQVNGGGDILFNADPTAEAIAQLAKAHRAFGTTALLPTLISDTTQRMQAASEAGSTAVAENPSILGIHFEGPYLSPDKPGVHDPALLRSPATEELDILTARRAGVTIVTLAPERVPSGTVGSLAAAGVRVCLGHSMATYDEARDAISEGLTGFTHLFNAMRPMGARDPGPIPAALERPDVWFGMIVDGVHVDPAMLRLALRGRARPMLVTDAMPPVGGTRKTFKLYGNEIQLHDGRCTRADGTLAGAALDMATAVRNAVGQLDMELTAALRAASAEPAAFLGLDDRLGRLAPGYRADLVAFDPETIKIHQTWVAGAS